KKTLASLPIEVVEAEIAVEAPEQVVTGAKFDVTHSDPVHQRDFVTIVATGAETGAYLDYYYVEKNRGGSLQAPAEPGLYEIRYVLDSGKRTLASAPIEVVEAEIAVAGPETVRADSEMTVRWTKAIFPRDFVTIVAAGAEEGAYLDYL